jgi:hypothetical protein
MKTRVFAVCAVIFLLCGVANAEINLIINGSFEDPKIGANSVKVFSSIPGWDSTLGIELRDNVAGRAYDGTQFVELEAYDNSSMVQGITTTNGTIYELSFWYSPRPNCDTNDIKVFWNDSQLGPTLAGSNPDSVHHWAKYTFNVRGTGGIDRLRFAADGIFDGAGGSLDAVSLFYQGGCASELAVKPYTFTSGTSAKATEVNADFDTLYKNDINLNCQIQALKAIVCQDHPTASVCQ